MFDSSKQVYETRKMDIYHCLKDDGIDVYFQGQHSGDCKSPYVVVASRSTSKHPSASSTVNNIEIMCYVPVRNPSLIELFTDDVKRSMKKLYPMLVDSYADVGDYVDDDVKAVMRTLAYTYYRKIEI